METATRIRSRVMRILASPGYQALRQTRGRLGRRLARRAPTIHYFHELTDPFSHLAVQRLPALVERYAIRVVPHLVSAASPAFRGDAGRFDRWALRDARSVAVCFGVEAPPAGRPLEGTAPAHRARLDAAVRAAASGDPQAVGAFAELAEAVGSDFWSGAEPPASAAAGTEALVAAGDALRHRLGHYQGAMFHFEGEWYWGLDRLHLLEQRLLTEGLCRHTDSPLVAPRPAPVVPPGLDASEVRLEVFPSLRSPYTAVGFPAIERMVAQTRVDVRWRPVMPMMMRGVAAPRMKQRYIMTDAAREARAAGVDFGRMVDPFGEPVRRALSLWAWVRDEGREAPFLSSYLRAAWAEGVDVTSDAGLARVVDRAGLDAAQMSARLEDPRSVVLLDENLASMLAAGLWGVPSFRVSSGPQQGEEDANAFVCWGQDRCWRVLAEIVRRAGGDPGIALPTAGSGP